MSKGMWTKQYTKDEKIFYYNCTLNKSQWNPPPDSTIHEAVYLKPPESESALEIERRKNLEAALAFTMDTVLSTETNSLENHITTNPGNCG